MSEHIEVRAIDKHDAPVGPAEMMVLVRDEDFLAGSGRVDRRLDDTVARATLDVEADWWSTSLDGAVRPIAEWVDHIVADIRLTIDGQIIDQASTAVVSGSWGALGSD